MHSALSFFCLIVFWLGGAVCSVEAQSAVVSGDYDGLMIGVDSKGRLTGYFDQGTGDDGKGNPRFTCRFVIFGMPSGEGRYEIRTWHPAFADDLIDGELTATEISGKRGINIRLFGEHGGCWNVAPVLKDEEGLDLELTEPGDWESVRMIASAKAFFHTAADAKTKQKAFVVKNDVVKLLNVKGDWAEVAYTSKTGRSTAGWILAASLYAAEPK